MITLALMAGTAGLPHVIVRFFTVENVRDARKSAGLALLFIAILYTTAPAVAVFQTPGCVPEQLPRSPLQRVHFPRLLLRSPFYDGGLRTPVRQLLPLNRLTAREHNPSR